MELGGTTMTQAVTTISEKYDAVQLELLDLYEKYDNGDNVESEIVNAENTLNVYRSLAKFLYYENH